MPTQCPPPHQRDGRADNFHSSGGCSSFVTCLLEVWTAIYHTSQDNCLLPCCPPSIPAPHGHHTSAPHCRYIFSAAGLIKAWGIDGDVTHWQQFSHSSDGQVDIYTASAECQGRPMEADKEGQEAVQELSWWVLHPHTLSTHTHTSVGINVLIRTECDGSRKTDPDRRWK